jgi:ABC-type lipoprotein export system ATPase subunit
MSSHAATGVALDEPQTGTGRKSGQVLLRAENLRKVFHSGNQQIAPLDGIGLSVERGEMIAIVGPSGTGKSTLLHLLAALDTPTNGEVYFGAKLLRSLAEVELAEYRNKAVGFVWQRHHLLPDFTAAENVAMPLLVQGQALGRALRAAGDWLAEVGLAGRAEQHAGELSGGEQQRVAIARALITKPAIVLADEPTGNLDTQNSDAVLEMLRVSGREMGQTVLMITHNPEAATIGDRILHMRDGQMVKTEAGRGVSVPV